MMSFIRSIFHSKWTHEGIGLIDPAYVGSQPEARRAKQPPEGFAYIHLFSAKFEDQAAARAFCYNARTVNTPEKITEELSGAFIDLTLVEVVFGHVGPRLNEFMADGDAFNVLASLGSDNTIIIIPEDAFGGFPFVVHNTATLTHLGQFTVPV